MANKLTSIDVKSLNKKDAVSPKETKVVKEEIKVKETSKEEKEDKKEISTTKRISDKVEDVLNKFIDKETETMMMYTWCCTICDLKDELSGRNFYMWSTDDCKWNIKKLYKYLASRYADIKKRNLSLPSLAYSDYEEKEDLLKFMCKHTEGITDEYNKMAKSLIDEGDMISYNLVSCVLDCQLRREKEITKALKEMSYPEKSVTISIESSRGGNDIIVKTNSSDLGPKF